MIMCYGMYFYNDIKKDHYNAIKFLVLGAIMQNLTLYLKQRGVKNMGKTIEKIERVAKMLNGRHMPKAYEVYKHFKGSLYVVITVARHTETNELFVIYSDIREMQRMYARPLEMFMSEVDHEKYPDAKQTYRFENMMEG